MITQYRPSYYQSPRASSFVGLSVDDKPLDAENGSTFKEIDTGRVFRYDKENNIWIEQKGATPVQPAKPEQAKTVDLNMATGNQTVLPDEDMTLSSATIIKPDTMIPENIKVGVNIGGVVGAAPTPKVEQTKTVDLDMAVGNQTISPDEGKVLSSVVVTKPTTLVAENIKKDVNIGGVIGTLEGGAGATEPYIEETYDANGNLIDAKMYGYTKVRDYAFYYCKNLALTSLPESLTSIGNYAFYYCTSLALTSLPEGLTRISGNAFYSCTSLALTSLPEGLTRMGNSAFSGCTNLALTSLPEGLTKIDDNVFYSCKNLALTSLPESLISIGTYAFYSCTSLTSITFKGTPSSIMSSAFNGCTNLTDIKVPWAEGAVANAPWGAKNATITYNYTE